jgi:ribosomal protein S24E
MGARLEVGMSFTHANGGDPTRTEVRASMMKVLIGVDPHKVSVAAAVVDEGTGELLGQLDRG